MLWVALPSSWWLAGDLPFLICSSALWKPSQAGGFESLLTVVRALIESLDNCYYFPAQSKTCF